MKEIMNELLNYDYHRIADWLVTTGIVAMSIAAMIVMGIIWLAVAAKKDKCSIGYKMPIANQTPEAWRYVNRTMGCLWLVSGLVLGALDALIMLRCMHAPIQTVTGTGALLVFIEVAVAVCCHAYVSKNARSKFANNVKRGDPLTRR